MLLIVNFFCNATLTTEIYTYGHALSLHDALASCNLPVGAGTPAVVAYLNNVPLPAVGTNIPTYDIANVQVLKGPQGTLFGRNTLGGAILVGTQAPTYNLGGYVQGDYGRYNYRALEGADRKSTR